MKWVFTVGRAKYVDAAGKTLAEIESVNGTWQIKGQPQLPQGWDLARAKRLIEAKFGGVKHGS